MNRLIKTFKVAFPILLGCILFVTVSCSSGGNESFDDPGFELEPIAGSSYQIARKYEGSNLIEEGLLKNGSKEGTWVKYHPKRKGHIQQIFTYAKGQLNGAALTFDAKGNLTKMVQYVDGVEHGQSIQYNFGKVADISPYKHGLLDGTFESFYGNEKIQQQIEYKKGKKDGLLKYYDEAGNVSLEYRYQNDEKVDGGMKSLEQ